MHPALPKRYFSVDDISYVYSDNQNSRDILTGRDRQQDLIKVDINQINDFYRDLLGTNKFLTSDEEFLDFIDYE